MTAPLADCGFRGLHPSHRFNLDGRVVQCLGVDSSGPRTFTDAIIDAGIAPDRAHTFRASLTMPNGVDIDVTVTVPESLTEGPVLLRDVGEISEHVQMCASRLRAAVLQLSEDVPF